MKIICKQLENTQSQLHLKISTSIVDQLTYHHNTVVTADTNPALLVSSVFQQYYCHASIFYSALCITINIINIIFLAQCSNA